MLKKALLALTVALVSTTYVSTNTELDPFRVKVIEMPIELVAKEVCPVGLECDDDISRPRNESKLVKCAVKNGPSCPRPPKKGNRTLS